MVRSHSVCHEGLESAAWEREMKDHKNGRRKKEANTFLAVRPKESHKPLKLFPLDGEG
jgi:hypothetical protein